MIKKLSITVLGVAVLGFCMAAVPYEEAEGAKLTVSGSHNHANRSGLAEASCEGFGWNNSKTFMTNSRGRYSATIKWLTAKSYYTVKVSAYCCQASNYRNGVYVSQNTNIGLRY